MANALYAETALDPELAALELQFEAADQRSQELTGGLGASQLRWRPRPTAWSIADCLDHLNTLGFRMLPRLDRAIADVTTMNARRKGPERRPRIPRLVIWFMRPPYRVRLKVPKAYAPPSSADPERIVRDFIELQGEFIKRLRDLGGFDLSAVKISSPVSRRLKFTTGDWLRFLATHQERHLWQAERVRRHDAFPAATGVERS